jgi:alpha-N-acetylglucosaminidase
MHQVNFHRLFRFISSRFLLPALLLGPVPKNSAEIAAIQAASGLVSRILPRQAGLFTIELIPSADGRDVFELESREDQIILRGNNGVAIAAALNWYLKYFCQCQISLQAKQLKLPEPLPPVQPKVRRLSQARWRYFLNYCCFGYSLPWYDWGQWERLIDWMALNGINAPLSVTGQETVWQAAGRRVGLSESDLREFLAGPPYLPFGWMGCLDGWGGPLPQSWIDGHAILEKKILARERELGMTPILQGFTGHVPSAIRKQFPQAKVHTVHWSEWDTVMLDPLDPLFSRFATTFIEEQHRLFGSDHLYAADTFIEMTPPSGDTNFLAAVSRAIYQGMAQADPQATWVLQGWTFFNQAAFWTQPRIEAFLNAVPDQKMLVLDLYCEVTPVWNQTKGFYGKPWVWCAIQNFGDCVYLGGALSRIHADYPRARRDPLGAHLGGLGFVNEGLDYNPIIFDFLFEQSWRSERIDLEKWVQDYRRRAYGANSPNSAAAWGLLKDTVFNGPCEFPPAYASVPSLGPAAEPPYSSEKLAQAWGLLLDAADSVSASDVYRFDLVSVTRQTLANYSAELQRETVQAWQAKERARLQSVSRQMLGLIQDVDELLATRSEYLLGSWLAEARRWGSSVQESDRLEWNARRVITMWGEQPLIRDYSRREWSGMLSGYYAKRWEKFFQALDTALAHAAAFDEKACDRDLQTWERRWAEQHETYPTEPRGDAIVLSRRLWEKYRARLARSFAPESSSLTTGKPVACSSALPGFPAVLANDGRAKNTDRYWATDLSIDQNPWWQVDLEKTTTVGRVVVVAYYGDQRYYGLIVEGSSDGQNWQSLADLRDNREPSTASGYTCRFPPHEVRYLRIKETFNSANTGRHLVEVMAFEK